MGLLKCPRSQAKKVSRLPNCQDRISGRMCEQTAVNEVLQISSQESVE